MDSDAARRRLQDMVDELDRSIGTLEGENAGDFTELSSFDQHPADSGSLISDAERQEVTIQQLRGQRDEAAAALERLDAGTYGQCVDCGRTIPDERLDARPEAARCVDCQAKATL